MVPNVDPSRCSPLGMVIQLDLNTWCQAQCFLIRAWLRLESMIIRLPKKSRSRSFHKGYSWVNCVCMPYNQYDSASVELVLESEVELGVLPSGISNAKVSPANDSTM